MPTEIPMLEITMKPQLGLKPVQGTCDSCTRCQWNRDSAAFLCELEKWKKKVGLEWLACVSYLPKGGL